MLDLNLCILALYILPKDLVDQVRISHFCNTVTQILYCDDTEPTGFIAKKLPRTNQMPRHQFVHMKSYHFFEWRAQLPVPGAVEQLSLWGSMPSFHPTGWHRARRSPSLLCPLGRRPISSRGSFEWLLFPPRESRTDRLLLPSRMRHWQVRGIERARYHWEHLVDSVRRVIWIMAHETHHLCL